MTLKMKLGLVSIVLCLAMGWTVTKVFAHGGGLDSCGGHNDRKHGGYHVHNMSLYCGCHPEAANCSSKSAAGATQSKSPATSASPSTRANRDSSLLARIENLESRVTTLEKALAER